MHRCDYLGAYCEDLRTALDLDAVRDAGVHIGADPMGGASVQYWGYIAEHLGWTSRSSTRTSTRGGAS